MKYFLFALLICSSFFTVAQTTVNPKIKSRSTTDVFISKIEIQNNRTVVSLYFQAKTQKESLNEFLKNNPRVAEKLRRMDPFNRQMNMQNMMMQMGGQTISFQPSSFLKSSDGKRYKFIGLSNIPKAPERLDAEPGKRYNFKVYFEKLPKGVEVIDLIENVSENEDGYSYWNFYGIKINNPVENQPKEDKKIEEVEEEENLEEVEEVFVMKNPEFRISGKIKDADNQASISAKINCLNGKNNIDSLQTSKSGSYEFLISSDSTVTLIVAANGYQTHEESLNIRMFKNKESLEKDIYLEKVRIVKTTESAPADIKVEPKAKEPEIVGVPSENKEVKEAFKLDKVYFNVGEATLLAASFEQLDKLVVYLKENQNLKIQIEGHTDNQGDPKMNKQLSLDRAFNVREYLVNKGISNKRIKFVGLGDTQPINSNNKEEDRKQNRRVEYRFID